MRVPTARQREVYETARRLGSQAKAARELGITQGAVRSALTAYSDATGAPIPRGQGGRTPGVTDAAYAAAIERAEAAEDALQTVLGRLAGIEGMLQALLERPTTVFTLSDRRIADGGEGRKHQRRRVVRGLPQRA